MYFSEFVLIFKICITLHCILINVRNTFKELFLDIAEQVLIHWISHCQSMGIWEGMISPFHWIQEFLASCLGLFFTHILSIHWVTTVYPETAPKFDWKEFLTWGPPLQVTPRNPGIEFRKPMKLNGEKKFTSLFLLTSNSNLAISSIIDVGNSP